MKKWRLWAANVHSPAPQPKDPMTPDLEHLLAVDATRASTCTTRAKEPVVDEEEDFSIEDLLSDSSTKSEGEGFVLAKRPWGDGASGY